MKIIEQPIKTIRKTPTLTALSFESIPELLGAHILDYMEIQDVFNFRLVNRHWQQLSNKAFASAKLCRQYFITFKKHDLAKSVLNKFEKAQHLTQSVQENCYNLHEKKVRNLKQIIFKDDKAYLNLLSSVEIWDSELKGCKSKLSLDLNSVMMMLVGNVLYCYDQPNVMPQKLELTSFDTKNHGVLSRTTILFQDEFFMDPMNFTFSEDKAFAGKKNGAIVIWELKSFKYDTQHYDDDNACALLTGHTGMITHLVYKNELLYSRAEDDKIKIWNINTRTCLLTIDKKKPSTHFPYFDFVVNSRYICGTFQKFQKYKKEFLKTIFTIWDQKKGDRVQIMKSNARIDHYYMHENLLFFLFKKQIGILDLNCGKLLRTITVEPPVTNFLNLQVVNDRLVVLFENKYNLETHVITLDFSSNNIEQKNKI